MSVILEAQLGNELICIQEFSASPHSELFSWKASRTFRVGERVRYAGSYQDDHFKDQPTGWMVLFDAVDGKRYHATQTFFVTEECWRGLKHFFARRLLKDPARLRPKADSAKQPGS